MAKTQKVTVLHVPVGEAPRLVEVNGSLKGYQELVGGDIEPMYPFEDEDVVLVCNAEGKLLGLPVNRVLRDERNPDRILDVVCGNFLLAYMPAKAESYKSLPKNLADKYMRRFQQPDQDPQPTKGRFTATRVDIMELLRKGK